MGWQIWDRHVALTVWGVGGVLGVGGGVADARTQLLYQGEGTGTDVGDVAACGWFHREQSGECARGRQNN